jgi:hypothetical protein
MNDVTIKHTKEFMEVLDNLHEMSKSFDIGKAMMKLTLNIICEAAFEFHMVTSDQDTFLKELDVVLVVENRNGIVPYDGGLDTCFPRYEDSVSARGDWQLLVEKFWRLTINYRILYVEQFLIVY